MDHATPNLPTRSFDRTVQFFFALGFQQSWRDESWLVITKGTLRLEFFLYPDLDPVTNCFSCCLRLEDLDVFYAVCLSANIQEATQGAPRLHEPVRQVGGLRIGALIDPEGTFFRLIQNPVP